MAQAFEIPTGQPDSASSYPVTAGGRPPRDTQQEIPSNAFQIAGPGPIQRRTGQCNMGPVSDRRKRINAALPDRNRARIPVRQSGKVNRFCRI
jgi:hypothetical protein